MSELSAPLPRQARARARLARIEETLALVARLQSQVRLQLAALSREDTPGGQRAFLCDELALALAESPGSAERMLVTAQLYSEHPAVVARVGCPSTRAAGASGTRTPCSSSSPARASRPRARSASSTSSPRTRTPVPRTRCARPPGLPSWWS
ncbi:MAG: hypothetical protein ACXVGH_10840, partial [Mycobacteriales bacterium]